MSGIDLHTHLSDGRFDPAVFAQGERLGVTRFVCSNIGAYAHHPSPDDVREMNAIMIAEMARHPGRLLGYCYVNPRGGTRTLSDLRHCVEDAGMVGIKLWVSAFADDPLVDPFLEYAAEHRLIVLTHAWRKTTGQLPFESTADHVARVAARHPDVRFLMAHLGGQVESAIDAVQPFPNVAVDTSGTIIGAGDVAIAVERLGADRVAFGSDLHHSGLAENVGKVLGAGLDAAALDRVLGGNARRWLSEVTQ
ncbi:amidohydrolase family protein [Microbacterium sp. CIAB417]|uniref:amidohydrolase family protein n=1 Tax=Microbacterium sp. CIAB417 TaxID=2860287 RepID=UPI001FAD2CD3|nr:amidohydrolase family protein [Microbacterium sp. CIAB417]